jgi:hypothetical protein
VIFGPGQPITHCCVPVTGIVSPIVVGEDGSGVAVATVGNEGLVGLAWDSTHRY